MGAGFRLGSSSGAVQEVLRARRRGVRHLRTAAIRASGDVGGVGRAGEEEDVDAGVDPEEEAELEAGESVDCADTRGTTEKIVPTFEYRVLRL